MNEKKSKNVIVESLEKDAKDRFLQNAPHHRNFRGEGEGGGRNINHFMNFCLTPFTAASLYISPSQHNFSVAEKFVCER